MFRIHPVIQTAKLNVLDSDFPGLQGFANNKLWTDEWYEFGPEKVSDLQYLLSVEESFYDPKVEWSHRNVKVLAWENYIQLHGIIPMMEAVPFLLLLVICPRILMTQYF